MAKKQVEISEATKERMKKMNARADEDVSVESFESESTSERQFHQKFMKIYKYVRKALVILNARKISKKETGEDLYNSALEVLENAKTL
jgi:hypothetical protein